MDDDRLSAASEPVHTTTFYPAPTAPIATQMNPPCTTVPHGIEQSNMRPSLPPVLSRIQEKMSKGEYIDFTTILPKVMFEVLEPHSQSLMLRLNPEGNNYVIKFSKTNSKIQSFAAWMEAWNIYLAVRVDLNPSCAPYLIAYQRIITSANSRHPLWLWLNYDVKFRIKAASNPSLRWDV